MPKIFFEKLFTNERKTIYASYGNSIVRHKKVYNEWIFEFIKAM